jgi:FtsP/CotA-like multicopper oxidase with cupredoxin domain
MRPGTTCHLDLSNDLPGAAGCTTGLSHDHSGFSCPDATNVHTHGLHVSGKEDDVSTVVEPGESRRYTYNLPANHLMGTHWFHAHRHGSTAIQLMGGLAGALLVSHDTTGPLGALPADIAALYGTDGLGGTLCVLSHFFFSGGTDDGDAFDIPDMEQVIAKNPPATGAAFATNAVFTDNALKDTYVVNGQYQPTATLTAGKVTLLRFVHAAGSRLLSLELVGTGATACTMQLIARDGVFQATPFITTRSVAMFPATRADIAIRCGAAAAGSTSLVFKAADNAYRQSFGGQVIGLVHAQDIVMKLAVNAAAATGADEPFPTTRPTLPPYLKDMSQDTPATFPVVGGTRGTILLAAGGGTHSINNKAFGGWTAADRFTFSQLCMDTTYEFAAVPPGPNADGAGAGAGSGGGSDRGPMPPASLQMRTGNRAGGAGATTILAPLQGGGGGPPGGGGGGPTSMHPLHIHIDHMQIMSAGDVTSTTGEVIRIGEWRDTVGISAPNGFVFRMRFTDFVDDTVLHCHLVVHEDRGMMGLFERKQCNGTLDGPVTPSSASHQSAASVIIIAVLATIIGLLV